MNIEEIKAKAVQELEIPGFIDGESITIKVQKPRIMAMMAQGKIPNPLMGTIQKLMKGQTTSTKDTDLVEMAKVFEFYCKTCMVEPSYEELADIITDEQMMSIFDWAIGGIMQVDSFRPDEKDGTSNNDVEGISETAE